MTKAKTVSKVYVDPRSNKRSADYIFTVKEGPWVMIHRYSTKKAAEAARKKIK